MSFFTVLKHMAQGKPLFQPKVITQPAGSEPVLSTAEKPMPRVLIEEVRSNLSGDRLETYATIKNQSQEDVLLDKITLLGERRELDETLKADDKRQVLIYSGPAPRDGSNHDAELQYHDMQGEYYVSRHDVRFKERQPQVFEIERMQYENTSKL